MVNINQMNINKAIGLAAAVCLLCTGAVWAVADPLFHINTAADSVIDPNAYVDGNVTSVTDDLEAPSAAWFNPSDNTLIDYIYIGESTVLTFHVTKEGKSVTSVSSEGRAAWEGGTCAAYPKCPV